MPTTDGSRAAAPPFTRWDELPDELRETFADVARAVGPIEVTLAAGDVLYLPCGWWHCVEGSAERNLILNYWLKVHPRKTAEGTFAGSVGVGQEDS